MKLYSNLFKARAFTSQRRTNLHLGETLPFGGMSDANLLLFIYSKLKFIFWQLDLNPQPYDNEASVLPQCCCVRIGRAYMHCQGTSCTKSFEVSLISTKGQNLEGF
jgi:hypothetical protein